METWHYPDLCMRPILSEVLTGHLVPEPFLKDRAPLTFLYLLSLSKIPVTVPTWGLYIPHPPFYLSNLIF